MRTLSSIKLWHHRSQLAVKYLPVIAALLMYIHCILLLFGIRLPIAEIIFGTSIYGITLCFLMSYAFGFCWLHRQFLMYCFIMTMDIHYERSIGFGSVLYIAHWIMLLYGTFIFAFLIYRKGIRVRTQCNTSAIQV